jgi:ribonuclease HII
MPSFEYELQFAPKFVAGVDEAGRGPWAGPVVAAAVVVLDQAAFLRSFQNVNDSKQLTKPKRQNLFERLIEAPFILAQCGSASVDEIDSVNILQATFLAMERALVGVQEQAARKHLDVEVVLVDGNKPLPGKHKANSYPIVKGDSKSYSIAAASIFAKVSRDNIMSNLAREFPQYHWDKNAGYGTKDHNAAIEKYGVTAHHRKSYAPIMAFCRQRQ